MTMINFHNVKIDVLFYKNFVQQVYPIFMFQFQIKLVFM